MLVLFRSIDFTPMQNEARHLFKVAFSPLEEASTSKSNKIIQSSNKMYRVDRRSLSPQDKKTTRQTKNYLKILPAKGVVRSRKEAQGFGQLFVREVC